MKEGVERCTEAISSAFEVDERLLLAATTSTIERRQVRGGDGHPDDEARRKPTVKHCGSTPTRTTATSTASQLNPSGHRVKCRGERKRPRMPNVQGASIAGD